MAGAAAATAGVVGPYTAGKVLMSDPVQAWLKGQNNIGTPIDSDIVKRILATQALQAERQSQRRNE